jgi:hypothetical protein
LKLFGGLPNFLFKYWIVYCEIKACLDVLIFKDVTKALRKKENGVKREMEEKQSYDDIHGTIKKVLAKTRNKYFVSTI